MSRENRGRCTGRTIKSLAPDSHIESRGCIEGYTGGELKDKLEQDRERLDIAD